MAKVVTKIEPTINPITRLPQGSIRKRKVAAYARVSTDNEEQLTSYEAQVDYYTKYIARRPDWEFVDVYTDEGISGTNTKRREGFNRMINDALNGKIDLIITKSISRFARNTVDSLVNIRKLNCPHAQAQVGENGCSKEYIREDVLNGVVWESIKTLLAAADGVKEQVKQKQKEADQNNTKLVKKLAKLQKDREKCDAERLANVDQFMAGTLDKEVYQSRRADLTRKADRLDAEIAELEAKYHEAEVIQDDGVQNALEMLDMFSDITELDQDIVGALIEKVLVYDPRHVEIRWKFSDEVMKLLQG